MVRLTTITTKAGDQGETGLGDGSRVKKSHPRIESLGMVDEFNSVIGICLATDLPEEARLWLRQIQNDLFDLGADLCFPADCPSDQRSHLFQATHILRLEGWLDTINQKLEPLESFILPGGGMVPATLHWARTVCRRTERVLQTLGETEMLDPEMIRYMNRLSDFLFQLARLLEAPDYPAPLWQPGADFSQQK